MPDYFATKPSNELAADLAGRMVDWATSTNRSGLRSKWMKAYRMYFGRHWKGSTAYRESEILFTGEDGELQALTVNDFRNLIKHMLVLTTNQKPAFDPRATNTDSDSLIQTKLAKNILDYYVRDKRLRRHLHNSAELALVMGKAFVKCVWDKSAGRPYGVEDYEDQNKEIKQKMVYEGDVKLSTLDPFSVFVDQSVEDWNDIQWVITREWENRFDVAARYPKFATEILNLPTKQEIAGMGFLYAQSVEETDLIPKYEFYHLRSDCLPNGRFATFYSNDVVPYDGPMPYTKLPVFRIVPGNYYGSTEGYTEAFDIMNLQQAENVLHSTIFTNQSTFGVQNILLPEGSNLTALQIGKALQVLKYNPAAGEPKPLQLTSTPPEIFKYIEILNSKMETVFGMNSVARGNPDSEMSGKALGLLQSMAIQYASGFQESYAELAEDVGTFILHLIRDFAQTERMISIAGKFNRADMVTFKGSDLSQIDRVVVDLGNPMSRTLAGRLDIAKDLLSNGLIKEPQEYFTVLETGNLETMTEGPFSQQALIRQENEYMQEGKPVVAFLLDKHILHMQEHQVMLSRPDVRFDPTASQAVTAHIQQHLDLYRSLGNDPVNAQIIGLVTGEPPAPMPPPMMMPPGIMPAHPNDKPELIKGGPNQVGPQQGNPMPKEAPPESLPPGPQEALQAALK